MLRPRTDDKRWTAVRSSAPVFVLVSGWRVDADGTAHASLRCAGTRGGSAEITALAKAPDVAGAARGAFVLDLTVTPYAREGWSREHPGPPLPPSGDGVSRSRAP
ncbi:acetyl-CoA synthetase [Streptomyces sp. NPDC000987]|uniref:acetyl-CoA synthetase n=1 Tax=Streptomyces sp. NPDC000987 TaxID=3154374 RepID=UPI003320D336